MVLLSKSRAAWLWKSVHNIKSRDTGPASSLIVVWATLQYCKGIHIYTPLQNISTHGTSRVQRGSVQFSAHQVWNQGTEHTVYFISSFFQYSDINFSVTFIFLYFQPLSCLFLSTTHLRLTQAVYHNSQLNWTLKMSGRGPQLLKP